MISACIIIVIPVCSSFAGRTATVHDNIFLRALMISCNSVRPRSVIDTFLNDAMYSCASVRLLCC